jgi:hypothetical protein
MKQIICLILFVVFLISFSRYGCAQDNAAVNYERAFELYKPFSSPLHPPQPVLSEDQIIQIVCNEGWQQEYMELQEFVKINEPAIQEFFRGVQKQRCDFSFGKEAELAYKTPLPNLLKSRNLATLILLKGRWYERNRNFPKGIGAYLSVLKFAQHISQNNFFTAKITAIAIGKMAVKPIRQYLNKPDADKQICFKIFNYLNELEQTRISLTECFEKEKKSLFDVVANMRLNGIKSTQKNKGLNRLQKDKAAAFYNEFLIVAQTVIDKYFDPAIDALKTHSRNDMDFARAQLSDLRREFKDDFVVLGEMAEAKDLFYSQKNLNKSLAVKIGQLLVVLTLPNLLETPYIDFDWREELTSLKELAKKKLAQNE